MEEPRGGGQRRYCAAQPRSREWTAARTTVCVTGGTGAVVSTKKHRLTEKSPKTLATKPLRDVVRPFVARSRAEPSDRHKVTRD